MRTKKLRLGLLALCAGFTLVSCDTVEATLPYDNQLLSFTDESNIYNNSLKQIYDELVKSGDSNSEKILNNVLYIYAKTIFAPFYSEKDDDGNVTVKGLYDVVPDYVSTGNTTEIDKIISSYAVYQKKDASGNIDQNLSRRAVKMMYDDILYRLNTTFLGYVKDSSYQERSEFIEEKFYKAQIKNYYNLPSTLDDGSASYYSDPKALNGSFRLSELASEDGGLDTYFKARLDTYQDYIEINLLPDIYRNELTSQYILEQNAYQIRNTAARKVDYIALPENTSTTDDGTVLQPVQKLVRAYADIVLSDETLSNQYGLTFLDEIYKGVDSDILANETAKQILTAANWTQSSFQLTSTSQPITYYVESEFGKICQDYTRLLKIDSRDDDNYTDLWNDFTSTGSYTLEVGFDIKCNELRAKGETTDGWYTTGGLSSLPDALSSRIFKIQVANEIANGKSDNSYLYTLGGKDYLIPTNPLSGDKYPYIVNSGDTYYICRVDEAVKSAKLDDSKSAYYGEEKAMLVSQTIAYTLSSSDTWKKAARTYYVEEMALIYHDEYVLSYFQTTFPDLFDD